MKIKYNFILNSHSSVILKCQPVVQQHMVRSSKPRSGIQYTSRCGSLVVRQIDVSIYNKKLAYHCLCIIKLQGIYGRYQFNRTSGRLSDRCVFRWFLKEFTVLMLTTSFGRLFQVVSLIFVKMFVYWCVNFIIN